MNPVPTALPGVEPPMTSWLSVRVVTLTTVGATFSTTWTTGSALGS